MAFQPRKNFAYTTVATAPSPALSGTSITLVDATDFPDPVGIGYEVVIYPTGAQPLSSNAEIALATAKVGNVLTITRAQAGTVARTILVGDQIHAGITARHLDDIEAAIPSTAGLISAINLSAGTTSNNLSKLTFSDSNGISFGLSGSVVTATVATNYQSPGAYLTTAALSQDSSKYAGTNGAITGGSITVNTSGMSVNLPAYLTTAMRSDAVTLSNIKVSAGASSALLSDLTFSNSNGFTFGLSGSTVTASYTVPTVTAGSDTAGISNLGNTAGTSGVVSGDAIRLLFAGGNNITLSQSINGSSATITISGANAGGAQTGISGIVVSDTTYTSGTVSFSNAGNITIGSSANGATQYIKLSGNAAQTTQSAIKALGVSNTGNSAGNTGVSTGIDWVVAGSNGITASQSTTAGGPNTIWISGVTTAAQTNQSAIKAFGVSNTGQTAGNTGVSTGIDWVLAGSDSITLSQSTAVGGPNTVWLKHPAWITTATQSSMTVSDAATSGTLARLAFTNLNGVTLSLSTGAAGSHTIVGSHNAITSQSTQFLAMTLGGNTAGTTTFHATNNASLFFNGGNNITLSGNGSTVTISAAAQTNQSAIKGLGASNTGNTAGNTGLSTGIDWVVAGSNNITISQSTAGGGPNTLWVSGPTVGGAQTGISGIIVSDATYTSGTVSFSNAGNITIASSVNGATQYIKLSGNAAQTNQTVGLYGLGNTTQNSSTTLDARTISLNGLGGITVGYSNGSVQISGPQTVAQSNQTLGLYALGNTTQNSSTTLDARTLSFNGLGAMTVGYSNGSIQLSVPTQTNQTMGIYVSGTTTGQSSSSTFDARSLSFSGFGPMSLGESVGSVFVSLAGALYAPLYAHLGGV